MNRDAARLGAVIRGARNEARMSREALGAAVGVSSTTVKRWELGASIGVDQIRDVAEALGSSVGELLRRAGLI